MTPRNARPKRLKPDPTDEARIEAVAMRYLARREYAAMELRDKLVQRGFDAGVSAAVVARLTDARLQDDARFVDAFVRARALRGQGPSRIIAELRARGIDAEVATAAVAEGADWAASAAAQRRRRFGSAAPTDWAQRGKQARFLEQRGFTHDQIRAALDGDE